jgi:glycogen debranching enzyme
MKIDSTRFPEQTGPRTSPLGRITTLVRGSTAMLGTESGEIRSNSILGFFDRDVRFISSLSFSVDGETAAVLDAARTGPSTERIVLLGALDRFSNGSVIVTRDRTVSHGTVSEQIEIRSLQGPRTVVVEVKVESDGAGILALKSAEVPPAPLPWTIDPASGLAGSTDVCGVRTSYDATTEASVSVEGAALHLTWKVELTDANPWTARWSASAKSAIAVPGTSMSLPQLSVRSTDYRWSRAINSAIADLDALIIDDQALDEHGKTINLRFVAAGAPWFLALFGRDMLLSAWQSLPLGTELALDVLTSLAHYQGKVIDDRRLEAPGKILHERRIGTPQVFGLETGQSYFGTVDASPLFVHLLGECFRWGAPTDDVRRLLPAARAALAWCRDVATKLGPEPTFLWYETDDRGLQNQSWKDSGDCMVHADGTLATGPFAVAEVQGYFHDALLSMALLETELGDPTAAVRLRHEAQQLRDHFARLYWSDDAGLLAMALDGVGEPLLVASSNMGQCLWSGILEPDLARRVADRVMQPDLLSPWGIRTLGDTERAYNPLGYHLGTVWAHDTAFIAAGMARHGFTEHTRTLIDATLDAAEHFGWRLPELFGGIDTRTSAGVGAPLPYPASCSPQAWSAGAPLLLMRAALGLEPTSFLASDSSNAADACATRTSVDEFSVDGIIHNQRSYRVSIDHAGIRTVTPS